MKVSHMPDSTLWWNNHRNLSRLVHWLLDSGQWTADDLQENIVYFLGKPWKWSEEFHDMQEAKSHATEP